MTSESIPTQKPRDPEPLNYHEASVILGDLETLYSDRDYWLTEPNIDGGIGISHGINSINHIINFYEEGGNIDMFRRRQQMVPESLYRKAKELAAKNREMILRVVDNKETIANEEWAPILQEARGIYDEWIKILESNVAGLSTKEDLHKLVASWTKYRDEIQKSKNQFQADKYNRVIQFLESVLATN